MSNWFKNLFGSKCCCHKGEGCCHSEENNSEPEKMEGSMPAQDNAPKMSDTTTDSSNSEAKTE